MLPRDTQFRHLSWRLHDLPSSLWTWLGQIAFWDQGSFWASLLWRNRQWGRRGTLLPWKWNICVGSMRFLPAKETRLTDWVLAAFCCVFMEERDGQIFAMLKWSKFNLVRLSRFYNRAQDSCCRSSTTTVPPNCGSLGRHRDRQLDGNLHRSVQVSRAWFGKEATQASSVSPANGRHILYPPSYNDRGLGVATRTTCWNKRGCHDTQPFNESYFVELVCSVHVLGWTGKAGLYLDTIAVQ